MMGGKNKGGLNVLWMPRKKKHHHHHNNYNKQNNKSYQNRPKSNHNMGHGSQGGASGFFGEPHSDHLIKKPSDVLPLEMKISDLPTNPSTSTDVKNEAETALEERKENEDVKVDDKVGDDEYLEKSSDTPDSNDGKKPNNQKKDEDSDDEEKEGLGFKCLYFTLHCCECSIS